jgi:hypothetical protein
MAFVSLLLLVGFACCSWSLDAFAAVFRLQDGLAAVGHCFGTEKTVWPSSELKAGVFARMPLGKVANIVIAAQLASWVRLLPE